MENKRYQMIIGNNIKAIRKRRGMTCSEVAEKMDISDAFCANIESGARCMSVSNLIKMANVLGVSVNELVYEKPDVTRFGKLELRCREKSDDFTKKIEEMTLTIIDLLEDQIKK